jgi:hypothetical protein
MFPTKTKKIVSGALAVACLTVAGGVSLSATTEASAVKNMAYSTTESQKNDIDYLVKHTILTREELNSMLRKGFSKADIQNLYILHTFADKEHKSYDKLMSMYKDLDKDVDKVQEALEINKDDFKDAYDRAFPEGDETDFGRAQNIKNLRYMPF